jgi:hypothetical protein
VKGTDDPMLIPRMFVNDESTDSLRDKVNGIWDLIGVVRERVPPAIMKALSPSDFAV